MKTAAVIRLLSLFFLMFFAQSVYADNRIVMFLKHAPEEAIQGAMADAGKEEIISALDTMDQKLPSNTSQKMAKNGMRSLFRPKLSGFFAVYAGYMDISDPDGLISFPLRHVTPKLYVAVTPEIGFFKIKGETVSHPEFIVSDENPVKMFVFERKQDEKKNFYWDVSEAPIPDDKKINPLTLVILTKPRNIFIPTGHFLTGENIQFVMPDLFVISNTSNDEAALKMIELKRYFEPINSEEKRATDLARQKMIMNL